MRELAIRRALGASAASLAESVARQAASIAAVGGAIGLAAAIVIARLMASLLYDVRAVEPSAYAGALGLVVVVIAAASALPATRAVRTDPRTAMRAE
jgi:putative ABC transport system permease protein